MKSKIVVVFVCVLVFTVDKVMLAQVIHHFEEPVDHEEIFTDRLLDSTAPLKSILAPFGFFFETDPETVDGEPPRAVAFVSSSTQLELFSRSSPTAVHMLTHSTAPARGGSCAGSHVPNSFLMCVSAARRPSPAEICCTD